MAAAGAGDVVGGRIASGYDRMKELTAFDETKAGVKGLVDAGVAKVPQFFIRPKEEWEVKTADSDEIQLQIPVIDLEGLESSEERRREVVEEIGRAAEEWGFFQVVNHGVEMRVLEEIIEGAKRFNEEKVEVKREYYTRDERKNKVLYSSNFDLYHSPAANWRDTLFCVMAPDPPSPHELPTSCREMILEYSKNMTRLGSNIFELLSEALGLHPNYLNEIECSKGHVILLHYYPACPEPDLTLGTSKHADPDFLTILLQDQIGGLQVLHKNQWINVPPIKGALVVNVGDLLQLISNDKYKSVEHRVLAKRKGPRISVACFFTLHFCPSTRLYGPIKELISDKCPPIYREILTEDYTEHFNKKGLDGRSALDHFKL